MTTQPSTSSYVLDLDQLYERTGDVFFVADLFRSDTWRRQKLHLGDQVRVVRRGVIDMTLRVADVTARGPIMHVLGEDQPPARAA